MSVETENDQKLAQVKAKLDESRKLLAEVISGDLHGWDELDLNYQDQLREFWLCLCRRPLEP